MNSRNLRFSSTTMDFVFTPNRSKNLRSSSVLTIQPLSRITLRPSSIYFSSCIGFVPLSFRNLSTFWYADFCFNTCSYLSARSFLSMPSNTLWSCSCWSFQSVMVFSLNKMVLSKLTFLIVLINSFSVEIRSVLYWCNALLSLATGFTRCFDRAFLTCSAVLNSRLSSIFSIWLNSPNILNWFRRS